MISANFARVLHRELLANGVDEAALLANTKLDRNRIWYSPQIDPSQFLQLLQNARSLVRDVPLGFMVAGRNRIAGLGMMGVAMVSAPTLREGLQAMASFSTVQAGYLRLDVIAGRPTTRVQVHSLLDLGNCLDIHIESVFSLVQEYIEDVAGRFSSEDHTVQFSVTYPDSGRRAVYETALHGDVAFNTRDNEIEFPTDWLKRPSPYADAELWLVARRYLSEQLQQAVGLEPRPFSSHLRSVLAANHPPFPEIAQVADSLHLSTRTLNRRLKEEDSNFRQLKLEAIHNWACRQMLAGVTVEAIALELGYENPANFRRSFREYMGSTPTEWLDRQRRAATE